VYNSQYPDPETSSEIGNESMKRSTLFATLCVVLLVSITVISGCDDLITEVTEVTIIASPTAEFTHSPGSGCAPLTVVFSDQSSGPVDSFFWDFGDGDSSSEASPTHIYADGGLYTVSLTVFDSTGERDIELKNQAVIVDQVKAAFRIDSDSGLFPHSTRFITESVGSIESYLWRFGDGDSSLEASPIHTFDTAGTYTVSLIVSGLCLPSADTLDSVSAVTATYAAPVADFSSDFQSGCSPLIVTFTDLSPQPTQPTDSIDSWSWDLGDGTVSTLQNPVHSFSSTSVDTYDIALTVTGPGGSDTKTETGYIIVAIPPVAAFETSDTVFVANTSVSFTDLSTAAESYNWDFANGQQSSLASPPDQTYTTPGSYIITLEASNVCGMSVDSLTITVNAP
jgi:PKD repeat protein